MATPAIRRLREARPDAEVHAVALRPQCRDLLAGLETVDATHYLPFWEGKRLETVVGALRLRGRFDQTYLAFPSVRREYHAVAFALGARRRISHDYSPAAENFTFLETQRVPIAADEHNVVNNLRLLGVDGIDATSLGTRYEVPVSWTGGERRPIVAFHVGTMTHKGNENKRWPLERFIAVARTAQADGFEVAIVDGPMERELTADFIEALPGTRRIAGPLDHVARELSSVAAVVAADNGIAHVAAAVGTPVVVLFGLTDPRRCRPWGEHVTVVRPSDCPPCFEFGDATFGCKQNIDFACLREHLQASHVIAALRQTLASVPV
jgi:ADP-heptose:LPS heptosyltransferase